MKWPGVCEQGLPHCKLPDGLSSVTPWSINKSAVPPSIRSFSEIINSLVIRYLQHISNFTSEVQVMRFSMISFKVEDDNYFRIQASDSHTYTFSKLSGQVLSSYRFCTKLWSATCGIRWQTTRPDGIHENPGKGFSCCGTFMRQNKSLIEVASLAPTYSQNLEMDRRLRFKILCPTSATAQSTTAIM
ncbi:hypothetical protein LZ30DRAFT_170766 [Colletotrichum cereale]|nr:hypothetical protein LZ30DRAFT_170766 [Colletotrichum cereale]